MADSKSVLIVEDDDSTRVMVTNMVESFGYTVTAFPSAEEALKGIEGKSFDLGIFDVMMPGLNGYELMKELKEIPAFEALPVIMLTAKNDPSEILEGYAFGADYYITKPFDARQLQYGIQIVLNEIKNPAADSEAENTES